MQDRNLDGLNIGNYVSQFRGISSNMRWFDDTQKMTDLSWKQNTNNYVIIEVNWFR